MFKQLFSRTPMDTFDLMNRKSQRTKYSQQSGSDTTTKHKNEHKYSTFFKKKKFSWQKYIFCNTVADDDADAKMPMPNGIDKKNLVAAS